MSDAKRDSLGDVADALARSRTARSGLAVAAGWLLKALGVFGWALVLHALAMPSLEDLQIRITPLVREAAKSAESAKTAQETVSGRDLALWTRIVEQEACLNEPNRDKWDHAMAVAVDKFKDFLKTHAPEDAARFAITAMRNDH